MNIQIIVGGRHTTINIDMDLAQQEVRALDALIRKIPESVRDHRITLDNFNLAVSKHVSEMATDDYNGMYLRLTYIASVCMHLMCVIDTQIAKEGR